MIPLIISIIIVNLFSKMNIDPSCKILVLFIVFTLSIWQSNIIVLSLLKKETITKRVFINKDNIEFKHRLINPHVKINSKKFSINHVKLVKNRRINSKINECLVTIHGERAKKPKCWNLLLTFPSLWFEKTKIRKWVYKPYLGKIVITNY